MLRARISRFWSAWPQLTGGRSFAATDADALTEVFRTIDALEKSPVRGQILTRYNEHFAPWAGLAVCLLIPRPASFPRTAAAVALTEHDPPK